MSIDELKLILNNGAGGQTTDTKLLKLKITN